MEITWFIVDLKPEKTNDINDKKNRRNNGIVDAKLGERPRQNPKEAELGAVDDITGDVECHDEAAQRHPYDKETPEIDLFDIFGVQK